MEAPDGIAVAEDPVSFGPWQTAHERHSQWSVDGPGRDWWLGRRPIRMRWGLGAAVQRRFLRWLMQADQYGWGRGRPGSLARLWRSSPTPAGRLVVLSSARSPTYMAGRSA